MENRLHYIMNASPEKRYKNFITTVADKCYVWVLRTSSGYATHVIDNVIHLLVWPLREYAEYYANRGEEAEGIEIHDFIGRCESMSKDENVRFMVFPTKIDAYLSPIDEVEKDIKYQLSLIE